MEKILFEDSSHFNLLPLTFTRPLFELRAGIFTCKERWTHIYGEEMYTYAYDYLGAAFNKFPTHNEPCTWINGKFVPDEDLLKEIETLGPSSYISNEKEEVLAAQFPISLLPAEFDGMISKELLEGLGLNEISSTNDSLAIRQAPDMFLNNEKLIAYDFHLITRTRTSQKITDPYTRIYGADNIFVEEGVSVKAAILNAEDGPMYLGKGANLQEGCIIRRSHAICDYAQISVGAKLRGDTTVGPYSKAGGEIGNSVIMGYSSKAHEGYLGNSVMGFWCNIGADTNSSNLKNNYANVRIWNYQSERFADTGLQFCGLIMGDHSKTAINTMFNTGTVVGVFANIFGSGFPRNFIPSFSWGGAHGFSTYQTRKAFEVAEKVMARRKMNFSEVEKDILRKVFELSAPYRRWEMEKV